jgi:hypothetical protein
VGLGGAFALPSRALLLNACLLTPDCDLFKPIKECFSELPLLGGVLCMLLAAATYDAREYERNAQTTLRNGIRENSYAR